MSWICKQKELVEPSVIGVEIKDEVTGEWSFLLLCYSFAWRRFATWCNHFASANQMASLVKAISDSQKICYSILGDLHIRNVPAQFAQELHLPFGEGYGEVLDTPYIRLPSAPGSPNSKLATVQWVGPCILDSSFRS